MLKKIILIWMLIFSSLFSSGDDFITTLPRKEKAYLDIEVTKIKTKEISNFEIDFNNKIIILKDKTLTDGESLVLTENFELFGSLFSINGRIKSLKNIVKENNLTSRISSSGEINILYNELPSEFYIGVWDKNSKNFTAFYTVKNLTPLIRSVEYLNLSTEASGTLYLSTNVLPDSDGYISVKYGTLTIQNANPQNGSYKITKRGGDINDFQLWKNGNFDQNYVNNNIIPELKKVSKGVIFEINPLDRPKSSNGEYTIYKDESFQAEFILKFSVDFINKIPNDFEELTLMNAPGFEIQPHLPGIDLSSINHLSQYKINLSLTDIPEEDINLPNWANVNLEKSTLKLSDIQKKLNFENQAVIQIPLGDVFLNNNRPFDDQYVALGFSATAYSKTIYGQYSFELTHSKKSNFKLKVTGWLSSLYGDIDSSDLSNKYQFISYKHGQSLKARYFLNIPIDQADFLKLKDLGDGELLFDDSKEFIGIFSGKNNGQRQLKYTIPVNSVIIIDDSTNIVNNGSMNIDFRQSYFNASSPIASFDTDGGLTQTITGVSVTSKKDDPIVIPSGKQRVTVNGISKIKDDNSSIGFDLTSNNSNIHISFNSNGTMNLRVANAQKNFSFPISISTERIFENNTSVKSGEFFINLGIYPAAAFEINAGSLDFGTINPADTGPFTAETRIGVTVNSANGELTGNLKFYIENKDNIKITNISDNQSQISVEPSFKEISNGNYDRILSGTIQTLPSGIRSGDYSGTIHLDVVLE